MNTIDRYPVIALPGEPMIPVAHPDIPAGPEWGCQLKWDGVRLLVRISATGEVELFSRKLLPKNNAYPELVQVLRQIKGPCLLDGEAFVFDPVKGRPVFRRVLERERLRNPAAIDRAGATAPVRFAAFDLLANQATDLRDEPYRKRHEALLRLLPDKQERLFVSDLFDDGAKLWQWVEERGWEGIVSKRLASPYREGKKHRDWLKKKTAVTEQVEIVGYTLNESRVASLVMKLDGFYLGRVGIGLNELIKRRIRELPSRRLTKETPTPFGNLPADLKGLDVIWLNEPLDCTVTGLEITDAGLLRHSKLVSLPQL